MIEVLEIKTLGDEVLKKQAALVPKVDRNIQELVQGMFEAMEKGNGLGLAAPQVGELKRVFVTHVPDDDLRVFINPEILATSEEQVPYEEGCLSIPGLYAEVTRGLPFRPVIKTAGFLQWMYPVSWPGWFSTNSITSTVFCLLIVYQRKNGREF